LAQFRELAAFAQFSSDLDAATKAKLDRGARIVEVFKQTQYQPLLVELQVAILWTIQNGYFDAVPVDKVKAFQTRLTEYLTTQKDKILSGIRDKKAVDDSLAAELKSALSDFVASQPVA